MIVIAVGFPFSISDTHHTPYGSNFLYQEWAKEPIPPPLAMIIEEPKPDYSEVNTEENVPFIPKWRCPLDKQCVRFVEKKLGRELNRDAYLIYPTTYEPCVDCGVLLYSPNPFGHIAYSIKKNNNTLVLLEQNEKGCGIISTRSISLDSWKIRGFITP